MQKNCDLVERTRIFILLLSEKDSKQTTNKKIIAIGFLTRNYFIKQQQMRAKPANVYRIS